MKFEETTFSLFRPLGRPKRDPRGPSETPEGPPELPRAPPEGPKTLPGRPEDYRGTLIMAL